MAEMVGVKIREVPRPPAREKESRKCQYSDQGTGCQKINATV